MSGVKEVLNSGSDGERHAVFLNELAAKMPEVGNQLRLAARFLRDQEGRLKRSYDQRDALAAVKRTAPRLPSGGGAIRAHVDVP